MGSTIMSASLGPKLSFISRHLDQNLDYSDLSSLLSTFQIEKLSYLFKFFDATGDGQVDMDDMEGMRDYGTLPVGARMIPSTSPWWTTTECSWSASWTKCRKKRTPKVWNTDPGR